MTDSGRDKTSTTLPPGMAFAGTLPEPHHPVTNPRHYTSGKIEVVDFILDKNLNFCLGEAVKYIVRAGKKDPQAHMEDLQKAAWYLQREMRRISDAATDY